MVKRELGRLQCNLQPLVSAWRCLEETVHLVGFDAQCYGHLWPSSVVKGQCFDAHLGILWECFL